MGITTLSGKSYRSGREPLELELELLDPVDLSGLE
jgi:hypothetical protein